MNERLSLVIVAYEGKQYLGDCLASIYGQSRPPDELFVVDNGSSDRGVECAAAHYRKVMTVGLPHNLGVAAGMNIGLRLARGSIVVFLNQDVILQPDCLAELEAGLLSNPSRGICGAKLLYPGSKLIQHAGGWVQPPLGLTKHYGYGQPDKGQFDSPRQVHYVTGAVLAGRRELMIWLGGFDEGFFPAYFEDVDLCQRIWQAGFKVVYLPTAVAYHRESVTSQKHSALFYSWYHTNRLRYVFNTLVSASQAERFAAYEWERTFSLKSELEQAVLLDIYRRMEKQEVNLRSGHIKAPWSPLRRRLRNSIELRQEGPRCG